MDSVLSKNGASTFISIMITALVLSGCSHIPSRSIAEEHKSDVKKITEGEVAPQKFHSHRFERYNEF